MNWSSIWRDFIGKIKGFKGIWVEIDFGWKVDAFDKVLGFFMK